MMMEKQFYVYMLASKRNGTLYLGVTSDIVKRVWQHKNGLAEGFTKKYGIKRLVYYEIHKDAENAPDGHPKCPTCGHFKMPHLR